MEFLLLGFSQMLNITSIGLILLGVILGTIVGAIPGFTATLGVALLLPFTFGLGPYNGMGLLLGIYVGAIAGGLISATLLRIPGTPSSILTTFDAFPLARKGKPKQALSIGIFSSVVGGLFSVTLLALVSPLLARLALRFGPWEYFALGIFGLTIVVSVSGDSGVIKGLITGSLGVLISSFGQDPILAIPRFTLGFSQMRGGFALLPTLLGFFAITQVLSDSKTIKERTMEIDLGKETLISPLLKVVRKSLFNLFRSSFIGAIVGILPGAGGSIAGFLAYDQAKRASKEPEKFGTGHYEGIVASESANNSVTGGAMIPMMTLGIPGDVVTAVLLGGLMIHGLRPGPLLFTDTPDVVGSIFVAMFIANIFMFFVQIGLMKIFVRIITLSKEYLVPVIFIMTMIGVFAIDSRVFDMRVTLALGVIGYYLDKYNYPLSPIVLGFILGPIIEENFRLGMMTRPDITQFFVRPISLGLLIFSVISLLLPLIKPKIKGN